MAKRANEASSNPAKRQRLDITDKPFFDEDALELNNMIKSMPEEISNQWPLWKKFYLTFWPIPDLPGRDYTMTLEEYEKEKLNYKNKYNMWIFSQFKIRFTTNDIVYLPYDGTKANPPSRMNELIIIRKITGRFFPSLSTGSKWIQKMLISIPDNLKVKSGENAIFLSETWNKLIRQSIPELRRIFESWIPQYKTPNVKNNFYAEDIPTYETGDMNPWGSTGYLKVPFPKLWSKTEVVIANPIYKKDYTTNRIPRMPDWTKTKPMIAIPNTVNLVYPPEEVKEGWRQWKLGKRDITKYKDAWIQYFSNEVPGILLYFGIHPTLQPEHPENELYTKWRESTIKIAYQWTYEWFIKIPIYSDWKNYNIDDSKPTIFGVTGENLERNEIINNYFSPSNGLLWEIVGVNLNDSAEWIQSSRFFKYYNNAAHSPQIPIEKHNWFQDRGYDIYNTIQEKVEVQKRDGGGSLGILKWSRLPNIWKDAGINNLSSISSQNYIISLIIIFMKKELTLKKKDGTYLYPWGTELDEHGYSFHPNLPTTDLTKKLRELYPKIKGNYENVEIYRSWWKQSHDSFFGLPTSLEDHLRDTNQVEGKWNTLNPEEQETRLIGFMKKYPLPRPINPGAWGDFKSQWNIDDDLNSMLDIQFDQYIVWVEQNLESMDYEGYAKPGKPLFKGKNAIMMDDQVVENLYPNFGVFSQISGGPAIWEKVFGFGLPYLLLGNWIHRLKNFTLELFKMVIDGLKWIVNNVILPALPSLSLIGGIILLGFVGVTFIDQKVRNVAS